MIDIEVNGTGLSNESGATSTLTPIGDVIAVRIDDEYKELGTGNWELGEPRRFYVNINISPDGKSTVDFKLFVP